MRMAQFLFYVKFLTENFFRGDTVLAHVQSSAKN